MVASPPCYARAMDRQRLVGVVLVLVSAASFGSGALFAKPVYGAGVGWLTLLAWRFLIGAGLSWAWLLQSAERRAGLRRLSRRRVAVALGLGIVYLGNSATYYAGLETVSASLAALVIYIYPAVVAVLSIRMGHALVGRRPWIALAMVLAGVALALGGIPSGAVPPVLGLLEIVASPLIYSVWIVLSARLSGERSEAVGAASAGGASPAAATALMMTSTMVAFWALAILSGRPLMPAQVPMAAWPGIAAIGVVSTFLAIQTFYAGSRRIGAAQASLISTIEPVWTIGLAALLFSERLGPIQLAGGALVVAGVLLAQAAPSSLGRGSTLRVADE
jgi:drug/metabolite transporter (DMT)-like permease